MRTLTTAILPAAAAAFLGLAPIQAQTGDDLSTGNVVPAPLKGAIRASITLPGGATLHTASGPISAQRVIEVPGTSTVIATWTEQVNGQAVPHYAFSLDGQRLAGRVRETSYTVQLKYANFDPLAGVPAVGPALAAPAGNEIYLVQCVAPAIPALQEAVTAAGGRILRHMEDHTMIVRMDAGARARVQAMPFVRWVGANHVAYKIETDILAQLGSGELDNTAPVRYSIECYERGPAAQATVAAMVEKLGGWVDVTTPDQFRMEATLSAEALLAIAGMNEVCFVDSWGGPGGTDMNVVRIVGGANALETATGYSGEGVRGEIFDTEVRTTHTEWIAGTTAPLLHSAAASGTGGLHGTGPYGINFARGADANARGLLPDAERGIFYMYQEATQFGGTKTRLLGNQELVNPAGIYRAVFQTSSVGSAQNTTYSTISSEVDDYLYQTGLLSTQSQSNTGNNNSRPQAWAKNIVSVGAVSHYNNQNDADDTWRVTGATSCGVGVNSGASIGPAQDGRIKPDLCFYFECTYTASPSSNTAYWEFSGTSGATPTVAGHFGLFFQMWHNGVWAGRGGASTVFLSRPNMMTAKAALINTAFRYNWPGGGANGTINRNVQGWGRPNVDTLYDLRNKTFIVDEEAPLLPLATHTYEVDVASGEPSFNVTMCYKDRAGTTSATTHRINDLSLRVTSPGGTVYYGNNGLTVGNGSTSGGVSNTKDTAENVFINSPAAGTWKIEVLGDTIVQDAHAATPAIDAVYSIWATGCVEHVDGPGTGPYGYSVRSNGDDHLYRIDLSTGVAVDLGLVGNGDMEGLSFGPNGALYGVTGSATAATGQLWDISLPPGSQVGGSFARVGLDAGLEFFNGTMYNMQGDLTGSSLYRINTATGAPTLVGTSTVFTDNLAIDYLGNAYGISPSFASNNLYSISLTTGAATLIGPLSGATVSGQGASSFSADNRLWCLTSDGQIFRINTSTGAATFVANVTVGGSAATGFEGLAIDKYSALAKMDLPVQSTTFTGNARGYYFTAPINGSIGGLRVPDPTALGTQNVEVVRFTAGPPPAFSATTNSFVSLFRAVNVAGNSIIPCDIPVAAGDIIGVLGTAGATGVNSYAAAGPVPSTMRGLPVTLTRMGMQLNLATNPAQNLWSEAAAAISRVEIYYTEGSKNVFIDGDKANTGLNMATTPLSTVAGANTWVNGELFAGGGGDPEFLAAGSQGNALDGLNAPNATCDLFFNYDVDSISFIYGGNLGGITVEAYNASGVLVDSFSQADTFTGAPAGPRTVAAPGIRRLKWFENSSGSFAAIDNVRIHSTIGCYANCDGSTLPPILNVQDFGCFLNAFAAGSGYANCDGSTTAPVLNVQDFGCFLNAFAAGCN